MSKLQIIILAAGKGKRMASNLPKVLHVINGKTMLEHVLETALELSDDVVIVTSEELHHGRDINNLYKGAKIAYQADALGTGHAVSSAVNYFDQNAAICVLYADNPFISPNTIRKMLLEMQEQKAQLINLGFHKPDANNYGKIITDSGGQITQIIEHKNATSEQQKITFCNSGIMLFAPGIITKFLPQIKPQPHNGEYYLTDMVEIISNAGLKAICLEVSEAEALGVNTQDELKIARMQYEETNSYIKQSY